MMDDAAITRMLARNRYLEAELERVDTERARLLEQISAMSDGRASFFGSFGHAEDSWNLTGLSERPTP